jgi:putative endonuclease
VSPPVSRQARGIAAEEQARRFLELQGLRTVERNFRTRLGELDLVMEHDRVLVFVEVRFRQDRRFGGPLESVNPAKCRRVALAAAEFLDRHRGWRDRPCRFDVAAICGDAPGEVEWIRDAFQL